MMKIYLASRYSRNPEMREVRDSLVSLGHEVTSRWIDLHIETGSKLEQSFTPDSLAGEREFCSTYAKADLDDIINSDCVVSFTGAGGKGGRHVEFGFGLALKKISIVVGPFENVFHTLPEVKHLPNTESLIDLFSFQIERIVAESCMGETEIYYRSWRGSKLIAAHSDIRIVEHASLGQ